MRKNRQEKKLEGFEDMLNEARRRPYYWYVYAELSFTEAVDECCPVPVDHAAWMTFKRYLAKKARVHLKSLDLLMGGGRKDITLKQMTDIAFALGKKVKIELVDIED